MIAVHGGNIVNKKKRAPDVLKPRRGPWDRNPSFARATILKTESHNAAEKATGSTLFVHARRRHGVEQRVLDGNATPADAVHLLLGANVSNTLEGALAQAHIFAEMVAQRLECDRHFGTLANHVVAQLEVCLALADEIDLDASGGDS